MNKSEPQMVEGRGKAFQAEGTCAKALKQNGPWDIREIEEKPIRLGAVMGVNVVQGELEEAGARSHKALQVMLRI